MFRLSSLILAVALFTSRTARAEFNPSPYTGPNPVTYPIATTIYGAQFQTADLDRDGRQDLLVYYKDFGLFLHRTLGATSLQQYPLASPQVLSTLQLDFLRIADLDQDGYPDIVACRPNYPSNNQIFWLRNLYGDTGSVSFETTPRVISAFSNDVRALFVADLDADGDPDVISCTNYSSEKFYLHTNRLKEATADIAAPVLLPGQGRYNDGSCTTFSDLDGDGDLDIATRLVLNGYVTTILWMENKTIDTSGYTLYLIPSLASSSALPATSTVPTVVVAKIQGELWFRFIKTGQPPATYREADFPTQSAALAQLRTTFNTYVTTAPSAFASQQYMRKITSVCRYRVGNGTQFTNHSLYSAFVPGTSQYYSPNQILCGDLDGDGDDDIFTGFCEAYEAYNGWFENRLNEEGHADFSVFHKLNLEGYQGAAKLADVDGNGRPDLTYLSTTLNTGIRVWYDCHDLRGTGMPWTEVVRKAAAGSYSTAGIGNFALLDLDGDGDLDIASDVISVPDCYLLLSENLTGETPSPFLRQETELISGLRSSDTFPSILAQDRDGDGDPDISLGRTGYSYRNNWSTAPTFGYTVDNTLGTFSAAPAPNAAVNANFNTWLAAQPWQKAGTIFTRLTADIDGDGDLDVVVLHGVSDSYNAISWFENRSSATPDFNGPFGITGNVNYQSKLACADYDSDGDVDVLALCSIVKNGTLTQRLAAFENTSSPSDFTRQVVDDPQGFLRNSIASPTFTAKLQSSADLNWATGETVAVTAKQLRNPHAMKDLMRWRDPARPKRFYRLIYSLDAP
ncbi:VCBS repeat-containing protein [Luteolibacter ambystomatis]|uniref:VCBS repeat-containing protein n=1 Tax=Luteolibacter ambystomatis TaxID=2824561 RepID=A0A975PH17_9BACT|nr:VCBS repeat-containing protein [Luteolibacter ambystomatis]QUE52872.1 VCBS repeat-containing protein [Luteolibacter ambystomatis]